jgi:peroxiredoxin
MVNLAELKVPTVLFFYPRNAQPHESIPEEWNLIPGARGCIPHSCGFRDLHQGVQGVGLSNLRRQHPGHCLSKGTR